LFLTSCRRVRTGQQKLLAYAVKFVTAACTAQSFENRYVLHPLRALRCRSVPSCRSTNAVLTVPLVADRSRAARTAFLVPYTPRASTFPTRFFLRVLCTVASVSALGGPLTGTFDCL